MAKAAGKNLRYLRENNTKEVIRYLAIHGGTSRIQLSKELGLSKMTITNIVSDLLEMGLINEIGISRQTENVTTGPKPVLLAIRKNRILSIGIFISRERILATLGDIASGELCFDERPVTPGYQVEQLIEDVSDLIESMLAYDESWRKYIVGIGIAMVGLVDSQNGVFVRSTNLLGDTSVPVKEILEKRFPYPVFVRNDMQASALAEQVYGLGRECSDFVYLGITYGIGTAVVSNGKVLTGSRGFAVEAGHMSVNCDGELCSCGNRGCVEVYASLPVLLRKTESADVEEMMDKYREKEQRTCRIMDEFVHVISVSLTNVANIFDIDKIIIGYEGALFDERILKAVEDNINRACLWRKEKKVKVEVSSLKSLGPIRGAATIVFQNLYMEQRILEDKYMQ